MNNINKIQGELAAAPQLELLEGSIKQPSPIAHIMSSAEEHPPHTRHLQAVPDLPPEPPKDLEEVAISTSVDDLEKLDKSQLDSSILSRAKRARERGIGGLSLMFYYKEEARKEVDPRYEYS